MIKIDRKGKKKPTMLALAPPGPQAPGCGLQERQAEEVLSCCL